jgi:inner membrane protein
MDPLTQGALGAALPQSVAKGQLMGLAMLCGFAGGMAPDLDVLIRSESDPLLFLEYHRQFTHSLVFIPIGAALVALTLWALIGRRRQWSLKRIYVFTMLGYATHALLDACTTYGTLLLWPFSDQRFAWNNVSIIDPLLTLPLLVLILAARIARRRWPAMLAMGWVLSYLSLGVIARDAAEQAGYELAASRGHQPALLSAKPSFANLLLWKVVYREGSRYYVDAIRLGREPLIYPGSSVPVLNVARDFPWLEAESLQAADIERFRWFSMDYLAVDPQDRYRIIDIRYSMLPNQIRALWGITLDPATQHSTHVRYTVTRDSEEANLLRLWQMLRGLPLPGAGAGPL